MQETYQLKFLKNVICKNKIRTLSEHKNSLELWQISNILSLLVKKNNSIGFLEMVEDLMTDLM